MERYSPECNVVTRRGKDIDGRSPYPFLVLGTSSAYYTQLELAAGLLLTLRIGFNVGEFTDFLLGWAHIDILSDDTE